MLRWNPDGEGKRDYPARLLALAQAKRRQFIHAFLGSAAVGFFAGLALTWWASGWDGRAGSAPFVAANALTMSVVMVLGFVASVVFA